MGFAPLRVAPVIITLGDSITEFAADPRNLGFQALLSQDYVRRADVINRGLRGWTTRWWVQYLPQLVQEWRAKPPVLITIALGTNDSSLANGPSAVRHVPLDEYQANLRTIVQTLRVAFPACVFLLLTPPAIDNSKWDPADKTNDVAATYATACEAVASDLHVPVIDTFRATNGRWDLFRDGVHPSGPGNVVFHNLIQTAIATSFPHLTPNAIPYDYPDL
ncbi:Aste57867_11966 [Aphanomyces stellatus]|uniref:Aste57867_11966 protein n=1 Tax=Aphanomyces stellatus TaxID=120398 RepID=A0A485KUY7_9STRA|nr:hypothetical protein As57867_011921 [Aphanomyces stellatus]VFT88821.1 Aste57867_11966 [Aphanomyces stellatus]